LLEGYYERESLSKNKKRTIINKEISLLLVELGERVLNPWQSDGYFRGP